MRNRGKIDTIESPGTNSKTCLVTLSNGRKQIVNATLRECKEMLEKAGKIVVGK